MMKNLRSKWKLPGSRAMTVLLCLGIGAAALAAAAAALNSLLTVRQLRLAEEQRRTLPILRKAAQKYLDDTGAAEEERPVPPNPQIISDR